MKGTREVCTPHAQRRLRRWTTRLLFGSLVLVAAGCRTPVAEEVAAVLAKGAERTALERTLGEPVSEREESLGTRAVYRYRYETYARREWSERVGREMFSAGRSAQGGLAEVVLASTVVLPIVMIIEASKDDLVKVKSEPGDLIVHYDKHGRVRWWSGLRLSYKPPAPPRKATVRFRR